MKFVFQRDTVYSVPAQTLFEFHERPDAFRVLSPEFMQVDVVNTATTLKPSDEIVRFNTNMLGVRFPFAMVHTVYDPPERFVDVQLRGFFSTWKHDHLLIQGGWPGAPATMLRDRIEYFHPLLLAGNPLVRGRLNKLFEFRHEVTGRELAEAARGATAEPKTIVITGATGLIGARLAEILLEQGHRVVLWVRNVEKAKKELGERAEYVHWDFSDKDDTSWKASLGEADVVVHLAGTPLFGQRWSPAFKVEMEESRTLSTREIVEAIRESEHKPEAFVTASAVGFYGKTPDRYVDETNEPGVDLLADICRKWEKEARVLEDEGVRTVQVRIGVVLSPKSGALAEMLLPFKLGGGGVFGQGHPWINWIHLEDVTRIFQMAIFDSAVQGPINAVAPHPVTNKAFAHTLAHVLNRPCLMVYPTAILKLIIGEAGEYASGGPRVSADLVRKQGYQFFFSELEPAMRNLLGRPV